MTVCFCGERENSFVKHVPFQDRRARAGSTSAKIVRCVSCRLMRTVPTPLLESEPDFYAENDVSASHSENIELWRSFSREILQKLKPVKASGRLLDVGCNIGVLVDEAAKAGYDARGIDLNQAAIDQGKKLFQADLSCQSLDSLGDTKFDVIVMNHVFEHIADLPEFTEQIQRIMHKDSVFMVIVPNAHSGICWTLNLLNKRKRGIGSNWYWYGYLPEQHVWQFGPKTLRRVLQNCGFKIRAISARQNMHWGATTKKGLRFRVMGLLWQVYRRLGWGDNLMVFCQKPSPAGQISDPPT